VGTKQIRLSDPNQIKIRMKEFLGKKINIVLHDGNVFPGELSKLSESGITIINMRLKKLSIELNKISELYFDELV
jgi:hypothetical protein